MRWRVVSGVLDGGRWVRRSAVVRVHMAHV